MRGGPRRIPWLLVRVAIYLAAIVVLLLLRGQLDWKSLRQRVTTPPASDGVLTLAGSDVAPDLLAAALELHRKDYPALQVDLQRGGSSQALQALLNRRAEVAVVNRPPLPQEQALFVQVQGDTAEWMPFALGALVVLRNAAAPDSAVPIGQLRDLVSLAATDRPPVAPRLYVPDPNEGGWDALCAALGQPPRDAAGDALRPPRVAFLADAAAVVQALRDDPEGLGALSGLTLPDAGLPQGIRAVALRPNPASPPVLPVYEDVGEGRYPLFHYLYVVAGTPTTAEGTMFVTYLVGERGQRQIERAGFLPAARVLRQVHLTKHPVGEHR